MKKNILEYDVLRVILTIIVVIGHCSYVVIESNYGGINYADLVAGSRIQFLINANNYVIYSFHMPCFIALSGAVYSFQVHKGNRKSFGVFFSNKFSRLLIPFFIVSFLYSVPIKYVTGYWNNSDVLVKDIFWGQILLQGNTHLWFLMCLFLIFLIFWCYTSIEKNKVMIYIMDIVIVLIAIFKISTPSQLINNVFHYCLCFWCGYKFEFIREYINNKVRVKSCVLITMIFFAIAGFDIYFWKERIIESMLMNVIHNIHSIIIYVAGSLMIYSVAYLVSKTKISECELIKRTNTDSMGIYLYSDPLNYVILYIAARLVSGMNIEVVAICLFAARFFITFGIAYLITELLRKFKIKYIA